ncbi:MAG: HEPN domain-containing protein [Myxococcota bacterium]
MTEVNRRQNIQDAVVRGEQSFRAAEALLGMGLCSDAVSRAYYAAFHFLRALLVSRGVEPRSHAGAIHLFNTEFVRPKLVPSSHNRLLAGLQRARELADYDAAVTFSPEDASGEVADARTFIEETRELLSKEGWLKPA